MDLIFVGKREFLQALAPPVSWIYGLRYKFYICERTPDLLWKKYRHLLIFLTSTNGENHMKLTGFLIGILMTASQAQAELELRLTDQCHATVEAAIFEKYGKDDETFSIVDMTVIYGGVEKNLQWSSAIIVTTSDEVDPRHVLVVTAPKDSMYSSEDCDIEYVRTMADGLLPDLE